MRVHNDRDQSGPRFWLVRPALQLTLVTAIAILAGTLLLVFQKASGLPWIDGAARSAATLHDHPGLNRLMIHITSLGAELLLLPAFLLLALWSYRSRGISWGRFVTFVMVGALALDNIVKPLVGRQRPVFDQLVVGRGESFPSGHTTATTALLLALAYYLAYGRTASVRKAVWVAAAVGSTLMGISRIYLGVHWPTDVIAGIALGAGWTIMCARSQGISAAPVQHRPASQMWTRPRRLIAVTIILAVVGLACSPSMSQDPPRAGGLPASHRRSSRTRRDSPSTTRSYESSTQSRTWFSSTVPSKVTVFQ
jgi:membrane-associated phospholipid phosphatase